MNSAKDLPSTTAEGLVIAAVPCGLTPATPSSAALWPTSPWARYRHRPARRRSQLANHRLDLTLRAAGEHGHPHRRRGDHGAVVVALAALERLGRADEVAEVLDPTIVLPRSAMTWSSSAEPTTPPPGRSWPPSTTSPATSPSTPSGPSSRSSARL